MNQNNTNTKLSEWIEKNYSLIAKMELISFAIFIIGFVLNELNTVDTNIILIVGILATALSLFFQSFKIRESENFNSYNALGSFAMTTMIHKLYFISLSIAALSLIGFVAEVKPVSNMVVASGGTLIVLLVLSLFAKMENKSQLYNLKFYVRIFIALSFLGLMLFGKGICQ